MCIIVVNNKDSNVYVFCVMDAQLDDFVVEIFLTNLCISDVPFLIILYYRNFPRADLDIKIDVWQEL